MVGAIRSELRKFFTTRMWWGMAIGIFVGGALFAAFFAYAFTSDLAGQSGGPGGMPTGDAEQIANSVYTAGLSIGYLLLLTIGVLQIGSEYRHKTITGTFLATPRRVRAMLAKVVALLVIGAVYGLVSLAGSVSVGAVVLGLRDVDAFPSTQIVRTLALSLLVLGLWALIGLGIGILIPNQVAALLIGIGVAWIVEPLASVLLGFWDWGAQHVVQFMPTQATNAIVNAVQDGSGTARLDWWGGALTLTAYAVVLAGIGIWRTSRADIA
ncbi:ABC transporter permease subunit [Phycicoccus endophyticus]|uniref:ABC transporter permease subunit n=1 Tax=Phycicoccus endophyticus TaxID=1690220 RepID=A0A7G9R5X5_9MICO|nr:ABC transporter permease subunit [Phycicoccus endophyticus]NHI20493.1 ABC transporter permease subunit [Phycicoccus endophyticus]QNN51000.1 ABC transporter permease subunit [Phycicoccus endophyticus]